MHTSFVDLQRSKPAVERTLVVSGGFNNEYASDQDPKAFVYEFADNTFPNTPLLQPRLGSVEQWSFVNNNNDEHPIHVHVNDFQVMEIVDAARGTATGVQHWGEDNANVPAPLLGPRESVIKPGTLALRSQFTEFTGAFVMHCHRLNHEDNGLMTFVNVIPAVSSFAVAASGSPGSDASVRVYDGSGDVPLATVVPFPGFQGTAQRGHGRRRRRSGPRPRRRQGPGSTPEIVVYAGAAARGAAAFGTELMRFLAFDASFSGRRQRRRRRHRRQRACGQRHRRRRPWDRGERQGLRLGTAGAARHGAGASSRASRPIPSTTTGVTVAAGLVDAVSGRFSIVTAPGAGSPAQIKTFRFDLFTPNTGPSAWCAPNDPLPPGVPRVTSDFLAFDRSYMGGVSLSTGWIGGGAYGGAQSIVVGQASGPGASRSFRAAPLSTVNRRST